MTNYATVEDVIQLWRALKADELELVTELITLISAEIRTRAHQRGRDFDEMLLDDEDLVEVAKSVVVDVVRRYINDNVDMSAPSMSQMSQSAGGYSVSGTFLVPGGGLFLKNNELARLGLRRQRYGVIDFG